MDESLSLTTLQTETDLTADDLEHSETLNELSLREAQVSTLLLSPFLLLLLTSLSSSPLPPPPPFQSSPSSSSTSSSSSSSLG